MRPRSAEARRGFSAGKRAAEYEWDAVELAIWRYGTEAEIRSLAWRDGFVMGLFAKRKRDDMSELECCWLDDAQARSRRPAGSDSDRAKKPERP